MKLNVKAFAKINLILDIVGKRNDGYHLLNMVMQSVSLFDSITLTDGDREGEIDIQSSHDGVPEDESNIAFRAAKTFFDYTGLANPGLRVKIKKRIPLAAGLAGGSADGAAVILALNTLFQTDLSEDDLTEIGLRVGSDVPFCLEGGTMLVEGTGGILSPLPAMPECYLLLAKPEWGISTKEAYDRFDGREDYRHPNVERMVDAICSSDLQEIAKSVDNIFEQLEGYESNTAIKQIMMEHGALGCAMTGSGSTVFGIFSGKGDCDRCADDLEELAETWICQPAPQGCELDD